MAVTPKRFMLSFKRSVTRFVPARLNVCEWLRPNFQQLAKVNGCYLPAQAIRSADAYPADAHCVLLTQAQQPTRSHLGECISVMKSACRYPG
jgi:hypothetical protein